MKIIETTNLSDLTFKDLYSMLLKEVGISIKENKKYLLAHKLSKFVGEGKSFKSFEEYYDALVNDKSGILLREFINTLTTNFSYFFREEVHFNFLKEYLLKNIEIQPYIRFWSAGCSTGEEAYSIAISCLQTVPAIDRLNLKILATDISTRVIDFAKMGIYHYTKIRGTLSDRELRTYFTFDRENNDFIVKDRVKNLVTFYRMNLLEPFPFKKMFDIVFLRNVLIYFNNSEKELIVNKIYNFIKPNGFLILGLSETLIGIKHFYKSLKSSIYQKQSRN